MVAKVQIFSPRSDSIVILLSPTHRDKRDKQSRTPDEPKMRDNDQNVFTIQPACLCPNSYTGKDARQKLMTHEDTLQNGICGGTFPFTTCRSRLTKPSASTNQDRKRIRIFLCHGTRIKGNIRRGSFSFLIPLTVQFVVGHPLVFLRHKRHNNLP